MSGILTEIFILIAIAFIWWGFISILYWVVSKTLFPFVQWLLNQEWVKRQIFTTNQFIQRFWERYKLQIIGLWEFTADILIDPIFFGFVLVLLSNRLESIINFTKANPQYNFWTLLNFDMETDVSFYWWFVAIFTLWMMGKTWKHAQDLRRDKKIYKYFDRISEQLGNESEDNRNIEIVNKKIRENLKKIRRVKNGESKPSDKPKP